MADKTPPPTEPLSPPPSGPLPDMIVDELMRRWPASVPVLLGRRMACPGCLMARFMTVAEAAKEHGVEPDDLYRELAPVLAVAAAEAKETVR